MSIMRKPSEFKPLDSGSILLVREHVLFREYFTIEQADNHSMFPFVILPVVSS